MLQTKFPQTKSLQLSKDPLKRDSQMNITD